MRLLLLLFVFIKGCNERETKDGQIFKVKKGDEITIKLPDNVTIPYEWRRISENPLLDSIGTDYQSEGGKKVGSGGIKYWIFKAKEKGRDTLRFLQGHTQIPELDSMGVTRIFPVEIE